MNRFVLLCLAAALAVSSLTATSVANAQPAAGKSGIAGIWLGTLTVPGGQLRIVFNIAEQPDGKLTASLDSPDQGAKGIPAESVTLKDGVLQVKATAVGGAFEGKLSPDGATIEGTWTQSGQTLPLTLKRVESVPESSRPQEPKEPYPYREERLTFKNPSAGVTLAGTLTLPTSGAPFPAVVLMAGSGPQDRDEFTFGHRVFLVLADYLTRQGIAVLRYDKRGVGESTGDTAAVTGRDFANDALAAVEYLKTRPGIDPQRIGLIGHSEGAGLAPMVAAQSPDVAFIVLMAGSGMPGDKIILAQQTLIGKAEGVSDEALSLSRAESERVFAIVEKEKDDTAAGKQIRDALSQWLTTLTPEQQKLLGVSADALGTATQAITQQVLTPWFRQFLTYDPSVDLRKVKCPVLAIGGSKDLQVPPKENLAAIAAALKAGGNQHYTTKELPGLNHLFQTATTGSPSEYAKIEETISPVALKTVSDWILEQTRPAKPQG